MRVVVAGHDVTLCALHVERLATLAEADLADLARALEALGADRRLLGDRRLADRRLFPRAETRRNDLGRRKGDPRF